MCGKSSGHRLVNLFFSHHGLFAPQNSHFLLENGNFKLHSLPFTFTFIDVIIGVAVPSS